MKKSVKEPFLINPPKRLKARKARRVAVRKFKRFSLKRRPIKIKTRKTGLVIHSKKRKSIKRSASGRFVKTNPLSTLMLINKPKSKRRTKMARRKSGLKARRLSVFGRPGAVSLSSFSRLAPHSRGMHLNPARSRRVRHYRSNPALALPAGLGRIEIPAMNELAGGVAGFIAVKAIPSMLFPVTWRSGYMKYVSAGITVVALTVIANKILGRSVGKAVLMGGLIAIGSEIAGTLLAKVGVPMNYYLSPDDMGYYYDQTGK
jgi:hypothetical protein